MTAKQGALLPPLPSEKEWQSQIVRVAETLGWWVNHVYPGTRVNGIWRTNTTCKGWPDLTLWHPRRGGLIFVEVKVKAPLTKDQEAVHASLRAAGQVVYVWRPDDFEEMVKILRHRP